MIVNCGEALIDMVPHAGHDGRMGYLPCPGGSPFNVSVTLGRLDVPAAFLSRISTDFFGDQLVAHLAGNGVSTRYVVRRDQPTTLAFVSLAADEEPQYAFYSTGAADRSLVPADIPKEFGPAVKCIQFGSNSLAQEPSASTLTELMAREHRTRIVSLDPNVRPNLIADKTAYTERLERLVAMSHIVKVSAADLNWLYPATEPEASARTWLAGGPLVVVMTCGAERAVALGAGLHVESPTQPVEIVDTVGAGDTFHGALLGRLYACGGLEDAAALAGLTAEHWGPALDFANRAAAVSCSRAGFNPPTQAELGGA